MSKVVITVHIVLHICTEFFILFIQCILGDGSGSLNASGIKTFVVSLERERRSERSSAAWRSLLGVLAAPQATAKHKHCTILLLFIPH